MNNNQASILVTGGNGFVGKQICKLLSSRGIPVISISRSGQPANIDGSDYEQVRWISADVFNVPSWAHYLDECKAVIHCIGIIEEQPDKGITYEKHIFQAAKVVADATRAHGIHTFVYISAGAGAPDTPQGYMLNKVAAENYINELDLSAVIMKPGLIYGIEKPETIEEHKAMAVLMEDPEVAPYIRPNRPLNVETIARVAVAAALSQVRDNMLDVDGIEAADQLLTSEF